MNDADALAQFGAAMNDPRRSYIGDPYKNTHYVSIAVRNEDEEQTFGQLLGQLKVLFTRAVRTQAGRDRTRLYVYELAAQSTLRELLTGQISEERWELLDRLVRARGPIDPTWLRKMEATIDVGKSPEYVAARLNEQDVIDGMGGKRWTARKVRRALAL